MEVSVNVSRPLLRKLSVDNLGERVSKIGSKELLLMVQTDEAGRAISPRKARYRKAEANYKGGAPVWRFPKVRQGHYPTYLAYSHRIKSKGNRNLIVSEAPFVEGVLEGRDERPLNQYGLAYRMKSPWRGHKYKYGPNKYNKRVVDNTIKYGFPTRWVQKALEESRKSNRPRSRTDRILRAYGYK